jgi:hypothetical protein
MMSDLARALPSGLHLYFHVSKAVAFRHWTSVDFLSFVCRDSDGLLYAFSIVNDGTRTIADLQRDVFAPLTAKGYTFLYPRRDVTLRAYVDRVWDDVALAPPPDVRRH